MAINRRFPLHYITPKNPDWERVTALDWLFSAKAYESVLLTDLVGVQAYVTIAGTDKIKTTDDRRAIFVVKIAGIYYIRDGHHRVTNAILDGRETIKAVVMELEEENV